MSSFSTRLSNQYCTALYIVDERVTHAQTDCATDSRPDICGHMGKWTSCVHRFRPDICGTGHAFVDICGIVHSSLVVFEQSRLVV